MKRVMLFSLMVLGLACVMTAASASAPDRSPAVNAGVGVQSIDQEVALLKQNEVVSQAPPCVACLAQAGACSGGAGTICNKAQRCTCQWCGGNLVCRPRKGGTIPIDPIPESQR